MNIMLCYYLHTAVCRNTEPQWDSEYVSMLQEPSCREALFLHFSVQMARMLVWDFFYCFCCFPSSQLEIRVVILGLF